jgi:hypothetical protein
MERLPGHNSLTIEEHIRLHGRKKACEDSMAMSDAFMALLQLDTKVPSINSWSMLFICTLGMSLATWSALIHLFPNFPGALTPVPEAVNDAYRNAFRTFLLMTLSCHLTVLLLMLLLLFGSFGMRCEHTLFHGTGILFFHLILHGTGFAGGERLYERKGGRPLSVRSMYRCPTTACILAR